MELGVGPSYAADLMASLQNHNPMNSAAVTAPPTPYHTPRGEERTTTQEDEGEPINGDSKGEGRKPKKQKVHVKVRCVRYMYTYSITLKTLHVSKPHTALVAGVGPGV